MRSDYAPIYEPSHIFSTRDATFEGGYAMASSVMLKHLPLFEVLGELDDAATAFNLAAAVANAAGDMMGVLRARLGDARLASTRGNMPQAETILDETIERASQHGLQDVQARALHDRAVVAGMRGQY